MSILTKLINAFDAILNRIPKECYGKGELENWIKWFKHFNERINAPNQKNTYFGKKRETSKGGLDLIDIKRYWPRDTQIDSWDRIEQNRI